MNLQNLQQKSGTLLMTKMAMEMKYQMTKLLQLKTIQNMMDTKED